MRQQPFGKIYQSRGGVFHRTGDPPSAEVPDGPEEWKCVLRCLEKNEVFELGIKLESDGSKIDRMLVVSKIEKTHFLTGFDLDFESSATTIGSIMVLNNRSQLSLDGDGGLYVIGDPKEKQTTQVLYKPVSIQALWTLHMTLTRLICSSTNQLRPINKQLTSPRVLINWWEFDRDLWSKRPDRFQLVGDMSTCDNRYCINRNCPNPVCKLIMARIKKHLQNIMTEIDVDIATSKQIHDRVGALMPEYDLGRYKKYIDNEMLTVLGEMENSSRILDFLFLGSEWNAANRTELINNGITHILNITKEIDNFYPGEFYYKNILLFDVPDSDLLQHWEDTYKFILNAAKSNGRVLIHCKMGISRSASTVCAFLMKYKSWTLKHALRFLKERRAVVNPNDGFLSQLITYEGILNAIKNRHNFGHESFQCPTNESLSDIENSSFEAKEIRVKKLVQFIQNREKAEIRRSKSNCSSRSSKRTTVLNSAGGAKESRKIPLVALESSNNSSNSSSNDSFSPIQDTSFSSFDFCEGFYLDQSSDEEMPSELRSFHKLQDSGSVRLRTRQFEARIRRKKLRRKKIRDMNKIMNQSGGSDTLSLEVTHTCCDIDRTRLLSDPQNSSIYPKPCQQIYQTV